MTTPSGTAARPPGEPSVFHPERLIAVLGRFKVRYVLIGDVAARLQGYPWLTALAEITPAIEPVNFESLSTALKHLGARIYTDATPEGLAFEVTADALARAPNWKFATSCGRVDVTFKPPGTEGFADLVRKAVPFQVHSDSMPVAALDDILRIRLASGIADPRELAALRHLARRGAS